MGPERELTATAEETRQEDPRTQERTRSKQGTKTNLYNKQQMVWSMVLYFGKKNEKKKQNPPTYSLFRQQTYTQRFQNTKHFEARGQPFLQSEFNLNLQLTFQCF